MDTSGPSSSSDALSVWWKSFWALKIPCKIMMFVWRGFHEILPTGNGLYCRNISTHSNCPLCGFSEDSNAHEVLWCRFAQEVWVLFYFPFMVGQKEDISFKGMLFYASELSERDSFARILMITWSVWSERNRRTHGQQYRIPSQLKEWIFFFYEDFKKAQSSEDNVPVGRDASGLNGSEIEENNFSLLVDAAISEPNKMVGMGDIIFTPNKRIQATLSKPLQGLLSVLHAETLALVVGLCWAKTIGIPVKKIFSDSLCLVSAQNKSEMYHNEFGVLLSDIKSLLVNFTEASISHINRKYNVEAHNLAKQALQLDEEFSWMNENS